MKQTKKIRRKKTSRKHGKQLPDNRGTAKEEPAAWKTTGGAAKGKSRWKRRMRKNWEDHQRTETQQTEKGEETGRGSQNRSRQKNMEEERKQATVVTACGKNAERDHKDDLEPQHAESEDQRGKTRGSKRWNHRKSKPHKICYRIYSRNMRLLKTYF